MLGAFSGNLPTLFHVLYSDDCMVILALEAQGVSRNGSTS